jgi:O-acetyl-ADP-ribose deacetylase (regulator of RNase III)
VDKVKVILAGLKKYHFWVICAVVILVGLVMWTMATAELEDRTKALAGQIQKAKSDVAGLIGKPLVNTGVIEVEQKETDKVRDEAQKAWENLYNYQKEKNDWPAELGPDFHDMITTVEKQGPDAEIPRDYRELYQNFIDQHFPKLYEIIDIRVHALLDAKGKVKPDSQGRPPKEDPLSRESAEDYTMHGSGKRGDSAQRVVAPLVGKVYWNQADLRRVKGQFKEGATQVVNGSLEWDSTPSTRQVRLAQEDLWVYRALLRTIAATNSTQTYFHKMPIKRIDALDIAQAAADSFVKAEGRIFNAANPGGPGAGRIQTGAQAAAGRLTSSSGQMLASGGAGGPMKSEGPSLTDYRYVNQVGRPLRGDEKPPFEEYNMMPIHMRLLMNQRKIVNLIVNLANSSMPIEVRRVSIHPGEQGSAIDFGRFMPGKGPAAGMGPGGPQGGPLGMQPGGFSTRSGGESPRYGSGGGPGGAMGGYAEGEQLAPDERDPLDLPVEIDGIIYIFNVPKREKLGTGTVAAAAAAATTTPATGTIATPATPAGPAVKPGIPGTPAKPAVPATTPGAPATAPAVPTTPTAPAGTAPAPATTPAPVPGPGPAVPGAVPAAPRPAPTGAPATPAAAPSASGKGSG